MRTRLTNFLQAVVLIAGVLYIVLGIFLYLSPIFAGYISETWTEQIRDNELVGPLYTLAKGFAILLLICGFAMVMPLFDPLRYRGLVYYNGFFFPLLTSVLFLKNGLSYLLVKQAASAEVEAMKQGGEAVSFPWGYVAITVVGGLFALIAISSIVALLVTRRQALDGKE